MIPGEGCMKAFQDYGNGGRNEDRLRNYSLTDGIPLVWSIGEESRTPRLRANRNAGAHPSARKVGENHNG